MDSQQPTREHRTGDSSDFVEELMARCLELPESERSAFLERQRAEHPACAGELSARLELLQVLGVEVEAPEQDFPDELGDFRLVEKVAGGGMGLVFRAEQRSLGREVALKLIRPEQLYFPGARVRFQREVEAIARLKHPAIVPIYTVGQEDGVPYFAMEYIEGCTLSAALRQLAGRAPESLEGSDLERAVASASRRPTRAERPELFRGSWVDACLRIARTVAEALQHAHGRGILHRDIKPSNIVVTPDGRVVLIDFGLTSSVEAERITKSGSQVGTLEYMSPEQVRGDDLDPGTDVYSLGVTLYELLSLQVPFQGKSRVDTHQRILEGLPDSIRARNRRVSGDVEIVCLKAMELELGQRYAGAKELAADLTCVLERRPIAARSPGSWTRLRRWTQRKPAAALAVVLAALLGVGTPTALYLQQLDHGERLRAALARETHAKETAQHQESVAREQRAIAEEEARRSDQTTQLLIDSFRISDPDRAIGKELSARDVLDQGAQRVRTELTDQPLTRAYLMATMGDVYLGLSIYDESADLLRESRDILIEEHDEVPERDRVLVTTRLANAYDALGRHEEAEELHLDAARRAEALWGNESYSFAEKLTELGTHYNQRRDFARSLETHREAVRILRTDPDTPTGSLGAGLTALAGHLLVHAQQSTMELREPMHEQAAALLAEAHPLLASDDGEGAMRAARADNTLGLLLKNQGEFMRALPHYERALETFDRYLDENNVHSAMVRINLAGLWLDYGDGMRAIDPVRRGAEALATQLPEKHETLVLARGNVAGTLYRTCHYEEALEQYETVLDLQREVFGPDHPYVISSLSNIGTCLTERGDFEDAEAHFEEALRLSVERYGPTHPEVARPWLGLTSLYVRSGRVAEARSAFGRAAEAFATEAAYSKYNARVELRRAELLRAEGEADRAREGLTEVAATLPISSTAPLTHYELLSELGDLCTEAGDHENAARCLKTAREHMQQRVAPDAPELRRIVERQERLYETMNESQGAPEAQELRRESNG